MVDSSSLPETHSHLPSENPNSVEKLRQQEVVNYLKQVIEPTLKNDIISLGICAFILAHISKTCQK
jgi:hypothetical protein